jgi:hypothetical protein
LLKRGKAALRPLFGEEEDSVEEERFCLALA